MGIAPALLGIFLVVGIYIGLPYFMYAVLRTHLASTYRTKVEADPWHIFRWGWACITLMAVLGYAFLFLLLISGSFVAFAILGVGAGAIGAVWLIVDFARRFLGGQNPKPFWKRHPPPTLQYGMVDLYVALLVYGLTMAIFAAPAKYSRLDQNEVVFLALFFLLGEGIAFYAALDVLRRTAHLKRPGYRALFLGLLMAYSSIFWFFTWMAFRAWRFALWKQGEELERLGRSRKRAVPPALPPLPAELPPLPPMQQPPPLPPEAPSPGATPSA
ncbi:MAG: hypothetical protein L6R28_24955 [Planctomycetes bacterium]|nr:hypothetical protein [Planctomycetota bacterium]